MSELNYFQVLCLFWAALGIGSRVLMALFGERWKRWEMTGAYGERKPEWLYVIGLAGLLLIGYTWYAVFTMQISYSWIIALFVSLTGIKIYMLLFRYDAFRQFVATMLGDRKKMMQLNIAVVVFSLACIGMAVFLY